MLNLNYNFKGRNRSLLLVVTVLGGFFSVFYYTLLYPESPFNIPLVNYAVTILFFSIAALVYFNKRDGFIRAIEVIYTFLCSLIFLYNVLVVFGSIYPKEHIGIILLLFVSLVFSIDRYLLQKIFIFSASITVIACYFSFKIDQISILILVFLLFSLIAFYLYFSKKAVTKVATLSLNFESFINNELSGYIFVDNRKKEIVYTNKMANKLWKTVDLSLLLNLEEKENIELNNLKISLILSKRNYNIYRIDDISKEKESLDRYNHIFQQNLAGVYETDLQGKILVANDSFAKIFGFEKKEEIQNQNAVNFYKNPKERDKFIEIIKKEKHLHNFESTQIDKNGKEFYTLINIVFNEDTQTLNGIIIDISAKKIQEQKLIAENKQSKRDFDDKTLKLKGIFEGLKNVRVYTLDSKYEIISFNQTANEAYKVFHYEDLAIGDDFMEIWAMCFSPEHTNQIKSYIDAAFKGKGQYALGKMKYKEEVFWIESYINPIYSVEGDIKEISIINHDITEKQEYEKKLKDSLEEKDVLLKEVHHRVKNNLQVISSILNLQSNYIEDKKIQSILSESQNRIKTMSFIHESLYQTKNFIAIQFSDHLEKLINNLVHSYAIEKNKIKIETDIEELSLKLDIAIPCGLIVNEIISNSLKHAFVGRDEGVVSISMRIIDEKIHLEIKDDGIGIDKDLNIYESNTLGLQLIITLADQIDGTITIDNTEGTKFLIIFAP